ncbi:MAG: hypothetical protein JNK02_05835 [Planctomycetes bacterium]|nr:hypothetical protein [Planctomycetota bacterium]
MSAFTSSLATGFAGLALAATAATAQITPGNLVVVRVGDGSAALSSASTAVFLDEFTTAGAFVQTIALPTAASGLNQPLSNSGTATSEGFLNLSADGQYLVQGGYGTAPGLASVVSTTSLAVPRVIARTTISTGASDTSTALDAFSASNIRSATSTNGTDLFAAGSSGGVQHATLGATTATQLHAPTAPTNTRVVQIAGGQLYVSSSSGSFQGVAAVGTGVPTTAGQSVTLLPGFPTSTGPSAYDYFFADAATLYVADDRTNGNGGIQKWTEAGGTWTLQYTLAPASNIGCRGLTGVVQGGVATLYATTSQTSLNTIVSVTDTGVGAPFSTVSVAATNTIYRGLRLIPSAGTFVSAICFGDGLGTACPCGNSGATGNGCASSVNASGGNLSSTGTPSIGADTLVLVGSGMPNSSVLYFQGTAPVNGGLGSVFGDGLRCAGGSVIRLGTKNNVGGGSSYPAPGDLAVSVRGLCSAGDVRVYQAWYRNAASFCTPATFNLTNGLSATWQP